MSLAYAGDIDDLIPSLIQVESQGSDKAIGDNGKAFGCLQIWEVVIKDVNRVYKTNYKHSDMMFRYPSCEVCFLYLKFWGNQYTKKTGKKASLEVLSKIWNGGPNGWKKEATEKYWKKVLDVRNKPL